MLLSPVLTHDEELTSLIVRRLGNRIRNLRIVRQGGGLVIQGRTSTYYAKQLAQHAAMELNNERILANDIEVS
ncbi:MAG: hypothetical protein WCL32_01255 [Planctomycetota bacterium]|jgi:hypothetical protein